MTEEKKVVAAEGKKEEVATQAKEIGKQACTLAKTIGALNIFKFEKMLTPKLMTVVFIISVIASIVMGIGAMSNPFQGVTVGSVFSGLGIMVMGIVISRVYCELIMVFFRSYECLKKLADKAEK